MHRCEILRAQDVSSEPNDKSLREDMAWLPVVIHVGIDILKAQANLGGLDLTTLVQMLESWLQPFECYNARWCYMNTDMQTPYLPCTEDY